MALIACKLIFQPLKTNNLDWFIQGARYEGPILIVRIGQAVKWT